MITMTEAKALVAEAQAWFTGIHISPPKQALWAESLHDVRTLEVCDVRAALKRIATATREGYWRLEIAELIEVSKKVMWERVQLTEAPTARQLPATAAPDPEQKARTEAAMRTAIATVLGGQKKPTAAVTPEHGEQAPPLGHVLMTAAEIEERKRVLREQADKLERETMRDAFTVEGEPR